MSIPQEHWSSNELLLFVFQVPYSCSCEFFFLLLLHLHVSFHLLPAAAARSNHVRILLITAVQCRVAAFHSKNCFSPTSCSALLFFCFFFQISIILSPFVFSRCRQELCVVRSLRMVQGLRMHFVFSMDEMAWFHQQRNKLQKSSSHSLQQRHQLQGSTPCQHLQQQSASHHLQLLVPSALMASWQGRRSQGSQTKGSQRKLSQRLRKIQNLTLM